MVENLMVVVNFRGRERIGLFAPEKRTSISLLLSDAQEGGRTALT